MASEVENLVYVIEVRDEGSEAFKSVGRNIGKLTDGIISGVNKIREIVWEGLKDSVKAYSQFEDAMTQARRTMNLNAEDTQILMQRLQELSTSFEKGGLMAGVSATQLAKVAGIAGQLGISFKDNAAGFEAYVVAVTQSSVALDMSVEKTAESLGILETVFNIPLEKTKELAGAITILASTTKATGPQIIDFMTRIGPMFSELGGTAEQAAALGATLRESGISMEVAGTAISQVITKMQTDYTKFEEVLSAGGLSQGMLEMKLRAGDAIGAIQLVAGAIDNIAKYDKLAATQAMKDLGLQGFRVTQVMQSLVSTLPMLQENLMKVSDAEKNAQAVQDAYEVALDKFSEKWGQFGNMLLTVRQIIGEKITQALEVVLDKYINPLMKRFLEWISNSPLAEALLKAIGDAIIWLGAQIAEFGNKFMNWLEKIDSETAGMKLEEWFKLLGETVSKTWAQIKKYMADAWEWIKTTAKDLKGVDWAEFWDDVLKAIQAIPSELAKMSSEIVKTGGYIEKIRDYLINLKRGWEDFNETMINFFQQIIEPGLGGFAEKTKVVSDLLNTFIDLAIKGLGLVGEAVFNVADALATKLYKSIEGVIGGIQKLYDKAVGHSVFPEMVEWAGYTTEAVSGIQGAVESTTAATGKLGEAAQNQLSAWENVKNQIMSISNAGANPFLSIDYNALRSKQQQMAQEVFGQNVGSYIAAQGAAQRNTLAPVQQGQIVRGGEGININFNGTNIVDERSKELFAGEISRIVKENSHTIVGG